MPTRRILALASSAVLAAGALAAAGPAAGRPTDLTSASSAGHGYSWRIKPTGSDDEFRGLAAVSSRVAWVSGEAGTVLLTTSGGRRWEDVSPASASGLALRDIEAWDARHAVALSIGPGEDSRIYSTSNGGASWTQRFRNAEPDAFYDCLAFNQRGRGLALSDPVDGRFRLAVSRDFGITWKVRPTTGMPKAEPGEFAFAASGTCIVAAPHNNFWFVTGGIDDPRIFHSADGGRHWTTSATPLRGGPTAGIYSVDFLTPRKGVMVGGDFADEANGADAAAFLTARTYGWRASKSPVLGYRSGVAWITRQANTAIAVGPTGSDVSTDGGRTWRQFDDDRYDGIQCADSGACWASGTDGRVARLVGWRETRAGVGRR